MDYTYNEFNIGNMLPTIGSTENRDNELTDTSIEELLKNDNDEFKDMLNISEGAFSDLDVDFQQINFYKGEFDDNKPSQISYTYDNDNHVWNPCIIIDGENYRERAETLILKNDELFLAFNKKNPMKYKVPGGGTHKDDKISQAAQAECNEEARIIVKNIKYLFSYVKKYPIKFPGYESVEGSVTHLFVADYASQYRGFISKVDKDYNILYNGKFYSLKDKNHMYLLTPEHKYGLYKHFSNNTMFEKCLSRSKLPDEIFGIPEERKYPMPDKKHTISAIKFFNRVEMKNEKQLAKNILKNMAKYNIDKSVVGYHNRLRRYM